MPTKSPATQIPDRLRSIAKRNALLAELQDSLLSSLAPQLSPVELESGWTIQKQKWPIEYAYFPASGVISVIAGWPNYRLQVAIVARNGMAGLSGLFGEEASPFEWRVQVSGEALRVPLPVLKEALEKKRPLRRIIHLYARNFMLEIAENAVACGTCSIEQRVARLLVVYRDRCGEDQLPLTHEIIAAMLAVRRPSVSDALGRLQGAKVVMTARGAITVLDRARLEATALKTTTRAPREPWE